MKGHAFLGHELYKGPNILVLQNIGLMGIKRRRNAPKKLFQKKEFLIFSTRRFYKWRADVVFAIYIAVVHTWSFFSDQWRLYVKIWHPLRAGREKGSEEERGRGN
jgi:hypothetical protein